MIYKISPCPSFPKRGKEYRSFPKRGKEKEEIPYFPVQRAFFDASAKESKDLNFVGRIG